MKGSGNTRSGDSKVSKACIAIAASWAVANHACSSFLRPDFQAFLRASVEAEAIPTPKTLLLIPDFHAAGLRASGETASYSERLLAVLQKEPQIDALSLVNGVERSVFDALLSTAHFFSGLGDRLQITYSEKCGVRGVLCDGLDRALDASGYQTIVKIDTAELPPEALSLLARWAFQSKGVAVRYLQPTHGQLGSADEGQNNEFQKLLQSRYGHLESAQRITSMFGFLAISRDILPAVYAKARSTLERAERGGPPLRWGIEIALILSAYELKIPISAIAHPLESRRDRDPQKVSEQLAAWKRVFEAVRD